MSEAAWVTTLFFVSMGGILLALVIFGIKDALDWEPAEWDEEFFD